MKKFLESIIDKLFGKPAKAKHIAAGKMFTHVVAGGSYQIITDNAVYEDSLSKAVVYQNTITGQIWVRSYKQFYDGRFKEIC